MSSQSHQTSGAGGVLSHVGKAISQLGDPKIMLVLVKSAVLALAGLIGILFVLGTLWPDANLLQGWIDLMVGTQPTAEVDVAINGNEGESWWEGMLDVVSQFFYWAAVLAAFYFLFPLVLTVVISLFLDDIIDAVEARHYGNRMATRKVGLAEGLKSAIALSSKLLVIHLVLFIPYLILFIVGLGILSLALFTAVNAWAYGQEYFDMAAGRHFDRRSVRQLYGQNKGDIFACGLAIALLFLVPFLNMIASIIGVAAMTHQVHTLLDD